ncbi:hypothetical protein AB205_0068920, partial [Aquarana catesbeiana]
CVLDQRRGKIAGRLSFLFSSGVHWTVYEGRLEATFLFSFIQVCVGPAVRGGWRPVCIGLAMREDWRPLVFSVGVCWIGYEGRLKAACFVSFLQVSVGPLVKGGWRPVRVGPAVRGGVHWTGYEGILEATCLFSFLQVCIGLTMREDWTPCVFSLFCRCLLDQRRGKIAGRLSFLFSSGVCCTGCRGGWKPVVFSLFFRWVLDRLLGKIGGCLSFLFSSGVCWTGYEGRLQAACLVSYL